MSFIALCLGIRPGPRRHDSPWLPLRSTVAPQGHVVMFLTEVNAEANANSDTHGLVVQPQSASRNRPSVQPMSAIWTTCGQQACPVIRVCEAGLKNLEALVHRCLIPTSLFGSVWTQWLWAPILPDQASRALSKKRSGGQSTGKSWAWRSCVAAAEARNADDASRPTLRIPRPPSLTGRLAWTQFKSST